MTTTRIGDPGHRDNAITILCTAAGANAISLMWYESPSTPPEHRRWHLIQPFRIVQGEHNLLFIAWQYAPAPGFRNFRFDYVARLVPSPYPGLFDSSQTFSLDKVLPERAVSARLPEHPYRRNSARVRDVELFLLDAMLNAAPDPDRPPALPRLKPEIVKALADRLRS